MLGLSSGHRRPRFVKDFLAEGGSVAGAVAGAMLGGTAANALQSSGGTQPGLSITVRLDSGRLVNIVQNANVNIQPGQRVQVLSGAGAARVEPI